MTPERAREIVSAINDRCMFTIGVSETLGSLTDVTLAEMLEAATIIKAGNAAAESVNGRKVIKLVPDDRLIAAAYCMEHYPCSNEAIVVMPMTRRERFEHEVERKALAVVPLKHTDADEDEDAEVTA